MNDLRGVMAGGGSRAITIHKSQCAITNPKSQEPKKRTKTQNSNPRKQARTQTQGLKFEIWNLLF
jgi:hypothetical protein